MNDNWRSIAMKRVSTLFAGAAALLSAGAAFAQPAGMTPEMIQRPLPLVGAPLAVKGTDGVVREAAFGAPGVSVQRPADLAAFPSKDTLPVVVWGNGGCAINAGQEVEFHATQASYGFLVLTTAGAPGERRQAT